MKTLLAAALLAGLLLAGCGKGADEAASSSDGDAQPQTKEVTVPSTPQPGAPVDTKRPHKGTLNITQNDLDRTKELRKQQMEEVERNK